MSRAALWGVDADKRVERAVLRALDEARHCADTAAELELPGLSRVEALDVVERLRNGNVASHGLRNAGVFCYATPPLRGRAARLHIACRPSEICLPAPLHVCDALLLESLEDVPDNVLTQQGPPSFIFNTLPAIFFCNLICFVVYKFITAFPDTSDAAWAHGQKLFAALPDVVQSALFVLVVLDVVCVFLGFCAAYSGGVTGASDRTQKRDLNVQCDSVDAWAAAVTRRRLDATCNPARRFGGGDASYR